MNVLKLFRLLNLSLILLSLMLLVAVFLPMAIAPNVVGPNYKNVTVWTQVNITNSRPEVINVTIHEYLNASLRNVTLNAGGLKTVQCNITVRDWNGFNDVIYLNATLWHQATSSHIGIDDNTSHYTNSSCSLNGSISTYIGWFICSFDIQYYANNGTWICNATTLDTATTAGYRTGNTTFLPVYALNVTDGIDYGSVAVEDFSNNVTANVTNLGNMAINITVEGYGARRGDGLAMNCSLGGNITVNNEHFSVADVDWASKSALTSTAQLVPELTIQKQTTDELMTNSTYWQLYIDSANAPGGNCTGYVIFTAIVP